MFNNRKDPLIDSVKKVMAENETRRQAEFDLNEELGIASKRALPHEHHANYDALLEQKIAEALHPNQQKLDVHEPEKDNLTAQDFKMLRAKKKPKVNEVIMAPGDTDDTADQIAKKLDQLRSNAMPTGTPEDSSKTISDIIGRMKINNAMKTFNSGLKNVKESLNENLKSHFKSWTNSEDAPRDDQSGDDNAVHRKAMSYLSGTKVPKENHDGMAEKLTNMFHGMKESINENHVLYTHPKADIKVVRKGEGSKEGAAIEVHKGGKKVASGDYDHGADAFFVNVGGKGQKSFDSAKDIANHFHGLSEQFQQIDEMAPKGAKYERMIKHIKDKYSKDGKLNDKEKSIAYATAWKAKNKNMEEGLTAEQVMTEIRKNLGEAKMKKIEEVGPLDKTENDDPVIASADARAKNWNKELENKRTASNTPATPVEPKPTTPNDTGAPAAPGGSQNTTAKPATPTKPSSDGPAPAMTTPNKPATPAAPTTGSGMKTQGSGAPGQDPGDRVSSAPSKLPTFASGAPGTTSKITPTPNVDKNVPTGDAPAAGAAALTKQTPRPATPSAAKPTAPAAAKDDIWDDSKIQRTGEGGTETAADFNRNSELYNKRNAAGGQRPAPEAPKPATPSASRPAAPRPATPSAGSSSNPISNSPDGPAPKMTNPTAAKRDGDGMTTGDKMPNQGSRFRDTMSRPNDPRGTQNDTVGRPQADKPGSYTRASSGSSDNPMASMAAGRAAERGTDSRTQVPASRILARKTKMNESLNDAITKILKG